MDQENKTKLMVVDDNEIFREYIVESTEVFGFEVLECENGERALALFETKKPDIILLDLYLPKKNGLEILPYFVEKSPDTPVIILSGSEKIEDVIKAFKLGAWDYITKPIQEIAILNHSLKKALQRVKLLKEYNYRNEQIKQTNKELVETLDILVKTQKELVESEKMAALGSLVAGIAHEINTPLGVGVTAISFLAQKVKEFEKLYERGAKDGDMEKFIELSKESTHMIFANLQRASQLVQSFKKIAVDQTSEKKRMFHVKSYIDEILLSLKPKLKRKNFTISVLCDENLFLTSYPGALSQIITNLILNSSFHAYPNTNDGNITIQIEKNENEVLLKYADDGKGIAKKHLPKIFDPFFTTRRGSGGSGLGLHILYNIVKKNFKGSVTCESEEGKGVLFSIVLRCDI